MGNGLPQLPTVEPEMIEPELNDGQFKVRFRSAVGGIYRLEFKNSLGDSNWTALPLVLGDGTIQELTDALANTTWRFYRVRRFR